VAVDSSLESIEQALTRIVRTGHLPRLHERLRAASGVDLDRTAYPVLGRLGEAGPLRLTDLAALIGLDVSTVSRHVADLSAKGLVERRPDPDDGRAGVLSLTRAGRGALGRIREVRRTLLLEVFADWTAVDRRELARLLSRFSEGLSKTVEAR
jgi:DNA-binding MarR family transcriptional regulator